MSLRAPGGRYRYPDRKDNTVPTRHGAPLGAPIWIDLTTSDLDRAQEFYGAVFGWTFASAGPEYGGYVNATKAGHPVAGMMANHPGWQMPGSDVAAPAAPDNWTIYLHTADIAATIATVPGAGGSVCVEPMEIKDKGAMALATDAAGAMVGMWQPTGHRGFEIVGEAGAPVWHQLTARDYGKAIDFYRDVFGWQTQVESDSDEFRYTTALFDGEQLLGVMDGSDMLPDGVPSSWASFFGADDVDKTLAVITEAGGTIVRGAEDTPYGRLAAAADPTGAAFNLSSLSV